MEDNSEFMKYSVGVVIIRRSHALTECVVENVSVEELREHNISLITNEKNCVYPFYRCGGHRSECKMEFSNDELVG